MDFLAAPGYQPAKQHELARALRLKAAERSALRHLLTRLELEGRLTCLRKNRWALAQTDRLVTGRLSVHLQGFAFLTPETGGDEFYVDRRDLGGALHGDRVVAEVRGRVGGARRAARVLRIVERSDRLLTGALQRGRSYWYVIPDDPRVASNIMLEGDAPPASAVGQTVSVRLTEESATRHVLAGRLEEVLGPATAPGVDMLVVLRSHGLDERFADAVTEEATRRAPDLSPADLRDRLDLRSVRSFTIDPADAKDHDDAVSLEPQPGGGWRLGVHIADVSHFVTPGTEVDREARRRGNSVYLVDRFIPMLPKHLTSEVCSLRPHVDRLTHSILLDLDAQGEVRNARSAASVIHSRARLNYDQVQQLLDGHATHGIPSEVLEDVRTMAELAGRIRQRRMAAGALDLNMPEVTCELDNQGRVIDIHKRGAPEAYHLIEEFMLLANVAVAGVLSRGGGPALYRIHEEPGEDQWAEMGTQLEALGVNIHPADRTDLQTAVRRVTGQPVEYAAQLAILRNLKRAVYSPTLRPHFGLAFPRYTHFTSPIRRYPDLVVHRLLKALEARRRPPHDQNEVARVADHCTQTERNADEAEQESLAVKRIAYYARLLEAGELGPWPGLVVALVPKGLIVELLDTLQRGLVPFATLGGDFFEISADRCRATGRRTRQGWRLGQAVQVELMRVDTVRRLVDFRLAGGSGPGVSRRGGRKAAARKRSPGRRQRIR